MHGRSALIARRPSAEHQAHQTRQLLLGACLDDHCRRISQACLEELWKAFPMLKPTTRTLSGTTAMSELVQMVLRDDFDRTDAASASHGRRSGDLYLLVERLSRQMQTKLQNDERLRVGKSAESRSTQAPVWSAQIELLADLAPTEVLLASKPRPFRT